MSLPAVITPADASTRGQCRPLLELRQLRRSYEGARVQALRGVDLELCAGEFVAVIGPSGCGKSTLLQLVGMLDRPDAGQLRWDGRDYQVLRREAAAFRSRQIGFVFQAFHLLPTLSALENVQIPMLEMPWSRARRTQHAAQLLEAVGLATRAEHRPAQLSGGERQRVAIARALANGPRLLLADEPTGSLDSDNAARVMELLRALQRRERMSLLVVTHDAEVAAHADRVIRMRDGRIIEDRLREVA